MKKTEQTLHYVVLGIACLLLIFSAIEVTQINTIRESGSVMAAQSMPVAGAPTQQPAQQPGQQPVQAPTMVGGC